MKISSNSEKQQRYEQLDIYYTLMLIYNHLVKNYVVSDLESLSWTE